MSWHDVDALARRFQREGEGLTSQRWWWVGWSVAGSQANKTGITQTRTPLDPICRDGPSSKWSLQRGTWCSGCGRSRKYTTLFFSCLVPKRWERDGDGRVRFITCRVVVSHHGFRASRPLKKKDFLSLLGAAMPPSGLTKFTSIAVLVEMQGDRVVFVAF